MSRRGDKDPDTVRLRAFVQVPERPPTQSRRACLMIMVAGKTSLVHLEAGRPYLVGRGEGVDVALHDPSVSRHHLTIEVTRLDSALVTDLESANGTYVNGQRIDAGSRIEVAYGDLITAGATQLMVELTAARAAQQVTPLPLFRQLLDAEIERATRYDRPLSVLAIDLGASAGDDAVREVAACIRGMDLIGRLDAGKLVVMLPEADAGPAARVADRILVAVRRCQPKVRVGLASWPADGRDAAALLAAAVDPSSPGDADGGPGGGPMIQLDLGDRAAVFADRAMMRLVNLVERLGRTELPVLILGETGVGKEIFARAVHHHSARAGGPFVAINCAALPDSLAEDELFGHVRGAFTSADGLRRGKIESASGGTLFLDEVGEMSLPIQAKLLRVLEERVLTRLGSDTPVPVDVRIVAATNRDLKQEIEAGRFRSDLYYRLTVSTLVVPPLRERPREIPLLVHRFAHLACARREAPEVDIDPAVMRVLGDYAWPGNVRELRNVVERAVAVCAGGAVRLEDLPPELNGGLEFEPGRESVTAVTDPQVRPLAEQVRDLEVAQMRRALELAGGVKKRAAELLDMPLRTFHLKLKKYALD